MFLWVLVYFVVVVIVWFDIDIKVYGFCIVFVVILLFVVLYVLFSFDYFGCCYWLPLIFRGLPGGRYSVVWVGAFKGFGGSDTEILVQKL